MPAGLAPMPNSARDEASVCVDQNNLVAGRASAKWSFHGMPPERAARRHKIVDNVSSMSKRLRGVLRARQTATAEQPGRATAAGCCCIDEASTSVVRLRSAMTEEMYASAAVTRSAGGGPGPRISPTSPWVQARKTGRAWPKPAKVRPDRHVVEPGQYLLRPPALAFNATIEQRAGDRAAAGVVASEVKAPAIETAKATRQPAQINGIQGGDLQPVGAPSRTGRTPSAYVPGLLDHRLPSSSSGAATQEIPRTNSRQRRVHDR